MKDPLMWCVLIAAGTGGFTVAMIGETILETLGALGGAFLGVIVALAGLSLQSAPVRLTTGTVLDATVAALWTSMLAWLAVLWWETSTGRVPPGDALR